MADAGLRDLGSFVPGSRVREPVAPSLDGAPRSDQPVLVTPPPQAAARRPLFGGDQPAGDALGIDDLVGRLAELVAHRETGGPLSIAFLGAPGAGKSFALARLVTRVREITAAAAKLQQTPFQPQVHVQTIDAATLEDDPAMALAASLHNGLRQPYPELAREIGHTARDPHAVLREVNEKLDDARRRLDSERRALDDAGSRRARLMETVLYEAAGSQVDAYARANRAGIENRMVSFGITGDPIRNYKDFVQFVAGSGGKVGLAMRSLHAFKGQTKLIVAAIVLVAIGIGLGIALADQGSWLADLRKGPQTGTSLADWLQAHLGLIGTLKSVAYLLALLALAANVWRAVTFLRPIFKGERLLESDLDNRRRDLDGHFAHQTKRVDALDRDVQRLSLESVEAERRAGGTGSSREPSPFERSGASQARSFFAVLTSMMQAPTTETHVAAPRRILLALDHLDAVAPERARAILDALHRFAGRGLVVALAADPTRLQSGGTHRDQLERWIDVPVRLEANRHDYGTLVQAMLGQAMLGQARATAVAAPDATSSVLDRPFDRDEASLLAALAELAGRSPRAVKRFVDLYGLARLDGGNKGALALMLALAQGGTDAEKAAVAAAAAHDGAAAFGLPQATPRLSTALNEVFAIAGRFTNAEAVDAVRHAAVYSIES